MASARPPRRGSAASHDVNGIDFVEVANAAQTLLRVHFLNAVNVEGCLTGRADHHRRRNHPDRHGAADRRRRLGLGRRPRCADPARSRRRATSRPTSLTSRARRSTRSSPRSPFSFKAGCPSDLDCATPAPLCPPSAGDAPPIDYLAKDFLSFRQALLDFSTLRYPAWQERSEADFGMMFLEALSAVADDLSYTQDRVATEATLLTATQRRSVHPPCAAGRLRAQPAVSAAATWLQFEVAPGVDAIPHGQAATAPAPDGTPVTFETGLGSARRLAAAAGECASGTARPASCAGYWFDDSKQCLPAGATADVRARATATTSSPARCC